MRLRPEDAVEDEVADLVAERLPGILVIAEVLARVDTARCRLIRGLGEALEAPHDARKAGIRQGEVQAVGAEDSCSPVSSPWGSSHPTPSAPTAPPSWWGSGRHRASSLPVPTRIAPSSSGSPPPCCASSSPP